MTYLYMDGEIQQRGEYKHEMYERGGEICWSVFLEEREMVEYGWEGLFLGTMLDSSPMVPGGLAAGTLTAVNM